MPARYESLVPEHPVAYPPERLVGREWHRKQILEAIQKNVRIIYLEGGAGIGKTRMLEEIPNLVKELPTPPMVLGIIDFYDTAKHTGLALEETIAQEVQRKNADTMRSFFTALDSYRVGETTEEEVHKAFVNAFNEWVEGKQAVLLFDTAEFLEYGQEAPEVVKECQVEERVPAVSWLRERLPSLNHTTAIIAARPTLALHRELKEAYDERQWLDLPLNTLSLKETYEYFYASEYGRTIDEEMIHRIWLLTGGRPILLSLAIDWLTRGIRLDEVYEMKIDELSRLKDQQEEDWWQIQRKFERALVSKIRQLATPIDTAAYYAARARKGFTAEILRQMLKELSPCRMELTPEAADELLNDLAKLSFVKHPYGARPGWYFLHDEMYELLDSYVWKEDYPTYSHQAETARFLAEVIYRDLIANAEEGLKKAQTYREMDNARRNLDILRTEQLFYNLESNPAEGYRLYIRLDAQAISQNNKEWDDTLRIELFRFIRTMPERARYGGLAEKFVPATGELVIADSVNYDSRAHWVHRFVTRGETEKAERIARSLLEAHPEASVLWKAIVMVGQGAAMVRKGMPEARQRLQEALEILEQPGLEGDPWVIRHYAGIAYLFLGLEARGVRDMARAANMYEKAKKYFEENGEPIEVARALNNLAFIWTQQGNYPDAINAAQEAVKRRRELGDVMGLALSLNTLAFVEDRAGVYTRARTHSSEALSLLRRAQQAGRPGLERAMALVNLHLGRILRHLTERELLREREIVEKGWREAEKCLQEAQQRVEELEYDYQLELYNQFGMLYHRWANWIALTSPQNKEQYTRLMRQADEFFRKADYIGAERNLPVNRADNLEDWAWIFHLRWAYREFMGDELSPGALEKELTTRLKEAEKLLENEVDPAKRGLQAHYVAGSVHHHWGRFFQKFKGDVQEALKHYALSVAYYDCFSPHPLERRDRVLEHIEATLAELPPHEARNRAMEMLEVVKEKGLPTQEISRWLQDIAGITF